MIDLGQNLSPFLMAGIIVGIFWHARMDAHSRAVERMRQLEQATNLLRSHAAALETFLGHPDAPASLKKVLILVSDAMADREVALRMAKWVASRPLGASMENEESQALEFILRKLQQEEPELADLFSMAVMTGVAGASLRWSETAALFDRISPRLVATPRRDVAIAVTASTLRSDALFSLKSVPMAA